MTDKIRDNLLITMAVAIFDLLDRNPSTLCRLQADKSDLQDAIEDMRQSLKERAWKHESS